MEKEKEIIKLQWADDPTGIAKHVTVGVLEDGTVLNEHDLNEYYKAHIYHIMIIDERWR